MVNIFDFCLKNNRPSLFTGMSYCRPGFSVIFFSVERLQSCTIRMRMTQKCTFYVSLSCLQGRLPRNGVMIFLPFAVLLQAWNEIKLQSEPKLFPQGNIQGKGLVKPQPFCNEDLFSKLMSMTLILEIIYLRKFASRGNSSGKGPQKSVIEMNEEWFPANLTSLIKKHVLSSLLPTRQPN